eukprot:2487854-Rhodomonas_salina.1
MVQLRLGVRVILSRRAAAASLSGRPDSDTLACLPVSRSRCTVTVTIPSRLRDCPSPSPGTVTALRRAGGRGGRGAVEAVSRKSHWQPHWQAECGLSEPEDDHVRDVTTVT